VRLLDLFFLSRPVLVAVVLLFPLAGARGMTWRDPFLWLLLLQDAALVGGAFVLNQLHDRAGDEANGKCPTLARTAVTESEARLLAVLLAMVGAFCAFLLGPWHLAGALIFFTLSALAYNLPPLRAKDRPLLAPLLAAPAYLLLVAQAEWLSRNRTYSLESLLLGVVGDLVPPGALDGVAPLVQAALWLSILRESLPMVLAGLSLSLLSTVPDMAGDRLAGKRTWAVTWGGASTWHASALLMSLAFLLAALQGDWILAAPALASALLMRWGRRKAEDRATAEAVLRLSVFLMALALCLVWPLLGGVALLLLWLARGYYQRRFHLDYPDMGLQALRDIFDPRSTS